MVTALIDEMLAGERGCPGFFGLASDGFSFSRGFWHFRRIKLPVKAGWALVE